MCWGFEDIGLALDFDRVHSLRLGFYELEKARAEAAAMKGQTPDAETFTTGEGIKIPISQDGPYPGELIDGVRSGRPM